MTSSRRRHRSSQVGWLILVAVLALGVYGSRDAIRGVLFDLTGEEQLFSQIKGLTDLSADLLRPRLDLAPEAPVKYANLNPFGVNVFLNEEVEPAKREQTVRLAQEAGFHWLRQEFPWQDIEIHGKGDFEDRRNPPAVSAWNKYDQIVDLAGQYDMELIVRVSTPPTWTRGRGDEVGTFAPPDNYDDFGDFVYTLVDRYKGRIRFYQLWNEPNIYPEWGIYPISPEDYTRLLRIGANARAPRGRSGRRHHCRRARQHHRAGARRCAAGQCTERPDLPAAHVRRGRGALLRHHGHAGVRAMVGPHGSPAAPACDELRPAAVRALMVANGDANKPIWISEMGWNTVPADLPDQRFGRVTPEQQARYTPLAYERAQAEWPWAGVVNTWYFKRATDEWLQAGRPEAYFRLADPDFTLQPVYHGLQTYMTSAEPALGAGMHEPHGWAIAEAGSWRTVDDAADCTYGSVRTAGEGSLLRFTFAGTTLHVVTGCGSGGVRRRHHGDGRRS